MRISLLVNSGRHRFLASRLPWSLLSIEHLHISVMSLHLRKLALSDTAVNSNVLLRQVVHFTIVSLSWSFLFVARV